MEKNMCPKCGSDMIVVGSKLICSKNTCDYVVLTKQKPWYIELSEKKELWNNDILTQSPTVIAQEYASLYEYLKNGYIHALQMKIKDLFETILKFFILVLLSEAFVEKKQKEVYQNFLYELTIKPPSLGTWVNVGRKLTKSMNNKNEIFIILNDIVKMYDKYNIVHWRNENIGHGAMTPVESRKFQDDIIEKFELIANHFNKMAQYYCSIKLSTKIQGKKVIELIGSKEVMGKYFSRSELYIKFSGKKFVLVPLIQFFDNKIYFFDSYMAHRGYTNYLNYTNNDHKRELEKKMNEMFKGICKITNIIIADQSAEDKIFRREQVDAIERIIKPDYLIQFDFLKNELLGSFFCDEKGIYLLQMEEGMGKTTFVKMLDKLGYNEMEFDENSMCRAFYINQIYSYSSKIFAQKLFEILRCTNRFETLTGEFPTVDIESNNARQQLANQINTFFRYYREHYEIRRLVIFIDGIDILSNTSGDSLINLIPRQEELVKGVYIILTSRTPQQISKYTEQLLNKVDVNRKIVIKNDNVVYRQMLSENIAKKTNIDKDNIKKIVELLNGKILGFDIVMKTIIQYGQENLETLLLKVDRNMFELLFQLYGEKYYHEIKKVILVLLMVQIPIPIKTLSMLIGERTISFKLLAYIEDIKSILDIQYTTTTPLVGVARVGICESVTNEEKLFLEIEKEWLAELDVFVGECIINCVSKKMTV